VAFVSDESGQNAVYVSPLSNSGAKRQVSAGTGAEPVWGANGRELFYRSEGVMMVAAMTPDSRPGAARRLFEGAFEPGTVDAANYDITPDQARFVMVTSGEHAAAQSTLHVVVNWLGSAPGELARPPERR
jgi:hypothetical protein